MKHYNNVRVAERHWPSLVEYMDGLFAAAGGNNCTTSDSASGLASSSDPAAPCLPTFYTWGDWCAVEARNKATPGTGQQNRAVMFIIRVGIFLDFVRRSGTTRAEGPHWAHGFLDFASSSTRTPHGAHDVRGAKRSRVDHSRAHGFFYRSF